MVINQHRLEQMFLPLRHFPHEHLLCEFETYVSLKEAIKNYLIFLASFGRTRTMKEMFRDLNLTTWKANSNGHTKLAGRILGTINSECFAQGRPLLGCLIVAEGNNEYVVNEGFFNLMDYEEFDEYNLLNFHWDKNIEYHRQLFFIRHKIACHKYWSAKRKREE